MNFPHTLHQILLIFIWISIWTHNQHDYAFQFKHKKYMKCEVMLHFPTSFILRLSFMQFHWSNDLKRRLKTFQNQYWTVEENYWIDIHSFGMKLKFQNSHTLYLHKYPPNRWMDQVWNYSLEHISRKISSIQAKDGSNHFNLLLP